MVQVIGITLIVVLILFIGIWIGFELGRNK